MWKRVVVYALLLCIVYLLFFTEVLWSSGIERKGRDDPLRGPRGPFGPKKEFDLKRGPRGPFGP